MTKLLIKKFGKVSQKIMDEIVNVVNESYKRLGHPVTDSVNLWIYEKSKTGTPFFATHSIWQGKPKLTLYIDKILEQPEIVSIAGIRRQVAHSILHGSVEFYHIRFPAELKEAMRQYKLSPNYANELLYPISMAAKEYEVTNFLHRKSFTNEQIAYAKHILELSYEDILSWKIALGNPLLKILYLVLVIRDVSCALPLLSEQKFKNEIRDSIQRRIAHLPPDYQTTIQKIFYEKISSLSSNTMKNITSITKVICDEILEGELKDIMEGKNK